MSVLELIDVGRRGGGPDERWILREISLAIEPGELVGVWGRRHSGRSTLLRIAAGLEKPDEGHVRLYVSRDDGAEGGARSRAARGGGARMCRRRFRAIEGELVLDQLVTSQLVCGVPGDVARVNAIAALTRLDAQHCATLRPSQLATAELVLVAIARSLTHAPRLLVIDEPTLGVELPERDRVLAALRSLNAEGTAVLASAGETTSLTGFDRVFSLSGGRLRGQRESELAPVLQLRKLRASGC